MTRTEIRTCIKCGVTGPIPQPKSHTSNVCQPCRNVASREYQKKRSIAVGKRPNLLGRVPYPLEDKWTHLNQKFRTMAKIMTKLKKRKDWQEQIRKNFDELIKNDAVLKWVYSHNDDDTKQKIKRHTPKNLDDTRNMDWDDFIGEDYDD